MRNSGKLSTFLDIFAGVNECSWCEIRVFLRLVLAIFWLKVAKNFGVAKIRVFLGRIFGVLWPQVAKKHGVSKIRVFLGRIFGISLASGSKETWHFQNSCLSGSDKFHSVGELSCWGCELEIEWQLAYPSITGKVQKLRKVN